jgi:hypothetical protein
VLGWSCHGASDRRLHVIARSIQQRGLPYTGFAGNEKDILNRLFRKIRPRMADNAIQLVLSSDHDGWSSHLLMK